MNVLSRSEQLQFLANDVGILDMLFANRDGDKLTIDGRYFPDGENFSIDLTGVEEITSEIRQRMVETVRDQWNARDDEQNAEKTGDEEARRVARGRGDSEAGNGGGSLPPVETAVQKPETSLLDALRERETIIDSRLEDAEIAHAEAEATVLTLRLELMEVQRCINVLQNESLPTFTDES